MTSEQLKTFLIIVETKSFSRTAETLFITQSSVSKRIHELEKEVGQILFNRDRAVISLTNAGNLLKRYAEQIMNMEEKIHEQIHQANQYASHLAIGTVYAYYDMYLSKRISSFSSLFPHIAITVRFGHTPQLLNELLKASIDVAFTHRPIDYSDYICKNIGKDNIVLVTDSQNERCQSVIAYQDVKELPIIDTNFLYTPTRRKLFPALYQPQITVDVASYALPLLKESHFFALLPFNLVAEQLKSGELREVKIIGDNIPPVNHYMIFNKSLANESSIQEFINNLSL